MTPELISLTVSVCIAAATELLGTRSILIVFLFNIVRVDSMYFCFLLSLNESHLFSLSFYLLIFLREPRLNPLDDSGRNSQSH